MAKLDLPRQLRYEVVQEFVLKLITDQSLKPGDRLPSSNELATMSNVSLISVRRGLDELERLGRIQRQQGVGTFVAQPRILSHPARLGDLLATLGANDSTNDLTTELLSLRIGLPGSTIAQTLRIEEHQPVWEVLRGRRVAGHPSIVERAILPLKVVPFLDEALLASGGSLYKHLADAHQIVDHSEEQYLEVMLPGAVEREWLKLANRELAVSVKGVSFNQDDEPFDCFQQIYPARKFIFYVSGSKEHKLLNSPRVNDWTVYPLSKS